MTKLTFENGVCVSIPNSLSLSLSSSINIYIYINIYYVKFYLNNSTHTHKSFIDDKREFYRTHTHNFFQLLHSGRKQPLFSDILHSEVNYIVNNNYIVGLFT